MDPGAVKVEGTALGRSSLFQMRRGVRSVCKHRGCHSPVLEVVATPGQTSLVRLPDADLRRGQTDRLRAGEP